MPIDQLLKPKTEKEIDDSLNELDPRELLNLGIGYDNPSYVSMAINKGAQLEESDLELMLEYPKWEPIIEEYIKYNEKDNVMRAIRIALIAKRDVNRIKSIITNSNFDFSQFLKLGTSERYKFAFSVMKNVIAYCNGNLNFVKEIYNLPQIKGNVNHQEELVAKLLDKIDFANSLDLLLSDNKLVKESIDDILKPKDPQYPQYIKDFQEYSMNVWFIKQKI